MVHYMSKRFLQTLVIVLLVAGLTFILINVMPRDQVYALYGTEISQEEYDAAYIELGLDRSIAYRFVQWGKSLLSGDFGTSYRYHMPVTQIIGQKIGITLYLSVVSTVISFPIGIIFGIICAVKRGKWQDNVITFTANLLSSVPAFVVAIALLYLFCIKLKWLPTTGFTFPWVDPGRHFRQILMPMVCLSIGSIAGICRQTRSSMLEAIRQDYVRTAYAKGLREKVVLRRHVLRNGLIPVVTLIGNRLAYMIGGSVFIENVFSIPGMGSMMVQAVNDVDVPVIQVCVIMTAFSVSLAYLFTDFLYVAVDPRISLK